MSVQNCILLTEMNSLLEEVNDLSPASANVYFISNSRQNFDLKYQMPKHNIHVNLLFCTKAFLFVCENIRCGQRT